jgi:hypothetical protein
VFASSAELIIYAAVLLIEATSVQYDRSVYIFKGGVICFSTREEL